jgi:hypothetical protein
VDSSLNLSEEILVALIKYRHYNWCHFLLMNLTFFLLFSQICVYSTTNHTQRAIFVHAIPATSFVWKREPSSGH